MANKSKKSEGPTCACGKGDLYEEWLKQNEQKEKEEVSDSTSAHQTDDKKSSADDAGKDAQKQEQNKK